MIRLIPVVILVGALCADMHGQQPPSAAQQQAMLDKVQPASEHRELAALAGRWTQQITYRMGGGQTMTATGTAVNRMILGGRFLVSESTSAVPAGAPPGMPSIESMRIYGFDRRTRQYTIIELDSMGTYWVSAAGTKTTSAPPQIVMSGETLDDHGGAAGDVRKYDMVLRLIDADAYVAAVVFKFQGKPDLRLVEVLHRRVK
jgi:hypothetical protein